MSTIKILSAHLIVVIVLLIAFICEVELYRHGHLHANFGIVAPSIKHCISKLTASEEEPLKPGKIFIFGLGYVGETVGRALIDDGWTVSGTCTNVKKAQELRGEGIQTHLFDEMTAESTLTEIVDDILSSQYILSTIPPLADQDFDIVLKRYGDYFRQSALNSNLKWIGYLSSTGVYGECGGAWVDEEQPTRPTNPKTQARAAAERQWQFLHDRSGLPVHIFRLAGIYGPERNALETLAKEGGDLSQCGANDNVCTSRIHVDDIVAGIRASMQLPSPGEVFNVADDLPCTRYEMLTYACRLLGYPIQKPEDVVESALSSSSRRNTRGGSKRVDNAKIKNLLNRSNSSLHYPDYRSGLTALASAGLTFSTPTSTRTSTSSTSSSDSSPDSLDFSTSGQSFASSATFSAADAEKDEAPSSAARLQLRVQVLERRLAALDSKLIQLEESQETIMGALMQITTALKQSAS